MHEALSRCRTYRKNLVTISVVIYELYKYSNYWTFLGVSPDIAEPCGIYDLIHYYSIPDFTKNPTETYLSCTYSLSFKIAFMDM